jgi:transcription elongation GreA/GreB family factor
MKVKEELYQYCVTYVQQRIARIQAEINEAQASANEETKSSVGDKYETSRAMAQSEVERNTVQLKEAEKLMSTLQGFTAFTSSEIVVPGSLVKTSRGIFYIAISLGLVTQAHQAYFIVSADSPIGKLLLKKRAGDVITWQSQSYEIQSVE